MKPRALVTVGLVAAALTVMSSPALACSIAGQPPLRIGLEAGDFDLDGGIYEQETIARAPSIFIRDAATASVVTKYWGIPPPNLGTQYEEGFWFSFIFPPGASESCAGLVDYDGKVLTPDGTVGTVGYGYAPPPQNATGPLSPEEAAAQGTVPWHRSAPALALDNGEVVGDLSEAESQLLEASYGPATTVEHPISTYIWATLTVWWPTVVGLAIIAFVTAMIIYHILEGRFREEAGSRNAVNA